MDKNFKKYLFLIVCLAALLRIVGISFGLPHIYHQDEPVLVNHAMAIGARGWNPQFFIIPPLTIYLLFFVYAALFIAGRLIGAFHGASDFASLFLSDPSLFYLSGRLVLGVLFGCATVAVLGILGKKYLGKTVGLWAALFLALCFMHAEQSHYIYADVPLTFFITLLFLYLLKTEKTDGMRHYFICGLLFGAAVATKYTAVYFLPPIVLYFIYLRGRFSFLIAAILGSQLAFFLIAPYTLLDWGNFLKQMTHQTTAEFVMGPTYHLRYSLFNGIGLPLLLLALVGALLIIKKNKKLALLFLSSFLFYYGVNIFFTQPFSRYMMPLVPIVCLLAALAWEATLIYLKNKTQRWIIAALLLIGTAAPILYVDALMLQKDTRDLCAEWFLQNVEQGTGVVLANRFYDPHLTETPEQTLQKKQWLAEPDKAKETRLQILAKVSEKKKSFTLYSLLLQEDQEKYAFLFQKPFIAMDRKVMQKSGVRYLVVNYSQYEEAYQKFRDQEKEHLKLVVSFSPYLDKSQKIMKDAYSSTAAPESLRELFSRKRLGPYLEVYELLP